MALSGTKVAILGAGSSAAYINVACTNSGIYPDVFTDKFGRPPGGAFWLRYDPSGQFSPKEILITRIGTGKVYFWKQWGTHLKNYQSSFPTKITLSRGYSSKWLWDYLWRGANIQLSHNLTTEKIQKIAANYDVVFMTFRTEESLQAQREFLVRTYVYVFETPWMKTNLIVYDGSFGPVVRLSVLFGKTYVEITNSINTKFELAKLSEAARARGLHLPETAKRHQFFDLRPTTPAWDPTKVPAPNIVLVGRYAEWRRKRLAHQAFSKTLRVLKTFELTGEVR